MTIITRRSLEEARRKYEAAASALRHALEHNYDSRILEELTEERDFWLRVTKVWESIHNPMIP